LAKLLIFSFNTLSTASSDILLIFLQGQWVAGAWSHLQGATSAAFSLMKDDVFRAVKDLCCCRHEDHHSEIERGIELRYTRGSSRHRQSTASLFGSSFRASLSNFQMTSWSGRNSLREEGQQAERIENGDISCSEKDPTRPSDRADRTFDFAEVSVHF